MIALSNSTRTYDGFDEGWVHEAFKAESADRSVIFEYINRNNHLSQSSHSPEVSTHEHHTLATNPFVIYTTDIPSSELLPTMSRNYTITIRNNSHRDQSFLLFQSVPTPSGIPRNEVLTTVYQRASRIPGDGSARVEFNASGEYYAITGTSHSGPDGAPRISVSQTSPAKLGPSGSFFSLTSDGGVVRLESGGRSTDTAGAFTIAADQSIDPSSRGKLLRVLRAISLH